MKQTNQDYKRCCKRHPRYLITYSCGPEPDQTLLVCDDHYKEEPFRKFIKKMELLPSLPLPDVFRSSIDND